MVFFIESYKSFGELYFISDEDLTNIGSFGGIMISLFRILGGILMDNFDFKCVYIFYATFILL